MVTLTKDPGRLRLSQGASLKPDESEGCSVSGGRTIRLYCYGELRVVPAPEAEVRSVASPFEFIPPVRVVPGSGARGNHPFSGDEVTIVRTPPIRVMLDED